MNSYPFVSIILPILNEALSIKQCLESLLAQDYPKEKMEIIIADGGSIDGTREIVSSLQRQRSNIKMILNEKRIVATGLNMAIRESKGEVIVRLDGHAEVGPDYVRRCVEELYRLKADSVGGRTEAFGTENFGNSVALAMNSWFGTGGAQFRSSNISGWVETVFPGVWKRSLFDEIGLFDEEMVRNQDDEFSYRMLKQGKKIYLDSNIRIKYRVRSKIWDLFRQYFQYGAWKVRVLQKHPRQMKLRQFVPALFVATFIIAGFLGCCWVIPRILFKTCALAYLAANLGASSSIAVRNGLRHIFFLPLIFLIIHLAYGLGFLAGFPLFFNRWVSQEV
ncbi:MAG: glycosyltransferase family 2 protein [Candidatus Omnitrophica bacterium]|nr:glycosyltransferase family 2 protein [Candidatus Omnitrophota bacterium]